MPRRIHRRAGTSRRGTVTVERLKSSQASGERRRGVGAGCERERYTDTHVKLTCKAPRLKMDDDGDGGGAYDAARVPRDCTTAEVALVLEASAALSGHDSSLDPTTFTGERLHASAVGSKPILVARCATPVRPASAPTAVDSPTVSRACVRGWDRRRGNDRGRGGGLRGGGPTDAHRLAIRVCGRIQQPDRVEE